MQATSTRRTQTQGTEDTQTLFESFSMVKDKTRFAFLRLRCIWVGSVHMCDANCKMQMQAQMKGKTPGELVPPGGGYSENFGKSVPRGFINLDPN